MPLAVELLEEAEDLVHDVYAETLASLPLAEQVPIRGVPTGPREHEWRATAPATVVWVEALDGGRTLRVSW